MTRAIGLVVAAALAGCGTTGGNVVSFEVVAQGAAPAAGRKAGVFDTGLGWHVELSRATLYMGAVYLNQDRPNPGIQGTDCVLPSLYTGEELQPLELDALSPERQSFPSPGMGTDDEVLTGEVWLTHVDVNAPIDDKPIAQIAGTATKAAQVVPFTAAITISTANRTPLPSPPTPSLHPVCKQRIVSPIQIDLRPHDGGTLVIAVDPSGWFSNVDFAAVPPDGVFPDDNSNDASSALFTGIRVNSNFKFSFE